MSISFHLSIPNIEQDCGVCLDPLDKDVVTHDGTAGSKHPLHKKCVSKWLKNSTTCPVCRVEIDPNSVFSLKEKTIHYIKNLNITPSYLASTTAMGMFLGCAILGIETPAHRLLMNSISIITALARVALNPRSKTSTALLVLGCAGWMVIQPGITIQYKSSIWDPIDSAATLVENTISIGLNKLGL